MTDAIDSRVAGALDERNRILKRVDEYHERGWITKDARDAFYSAVLIGDDRPPERVFEHFRKLHGFSKEQGAPS